METPRPVEGLIKVRGILGFNKSIETSQRRQKEP